MGFKKHWDVADIVRQLHSCAQESMSPYNDGWTAMFAKKDLYYIKCLLEDLYEQCPNFPAEEAEWEKERLVELLKK